MANVLPRERQVEVLRLMVEGNSLRSITRITKIHRTAVQRLLVRFGRACEKFMDLMFQNLVLGHVQMDELWTFCGKKEGRLNDKERASGRFGDQYLFLALDTETKLIPCWKLGKRNHTTTRQMANELANRMHFRPDLSPASPQISTDGWQSYPATLKAAFGGKVRHGVLVKQYSNPEVGRYAPPALMKTNRVSISGIDNLLTICTSHVERVNLTIRTFMRRFTRLAMGFSKKVENLAAACAVQIAYYNFCWRTREKQGGQLRPTPAMAAGVVDTLWTMENLFDEVMQYDELLKRQARYERLMARLRRKD